MNSLLVGKKSLCNDCDVCWKRSGLLFWTIFPFGDILICCGSCDWSTISCLSLVPGLLMTLVVGATDLIVRGSGLLLTIWSITAYLGAWLAGPFTAPVSLLMTGLQMPFCGLDLGLPGHYQPIAHVWSRIALLGFLAGHAIWALVLLLRDGLKEIRDKTLQGRMIRLATHTRLYINDISSRGSVRPG